MNCKPGDLAYITHPKLLGKMVVVLSAAPVGVKFLLPNGELHLPVPPGEWVIEALGSPFEVHRARSGTGWNQQACCADKWLRPIRGDLTGDTESTSTDKPVREPA